MKEIETEGRTVTIAVEAALKELGLRRDQVEVTVLDEGAAGVLGFGARPAKVKVCEKRWGEASSAPSDASAPKAAPRARLSSARPAARGRSTRPAPRPAPSPAPAAAPAAAPSHAPAPAAAAHAPRPERRPRRDDQAPLSAEDGAKAAKAAEEVLSELLRLARLDDAKVAARWDGAESRVQAEVTTADGGLLIGKGGRTLESIQFLTTILVGRRSGVGAPVQVECDGWWKRAEEKLCAEADRAALEVAESGRPFRFEPMEAALRRLVHRRLKDHAEVETASEGEGAWRRVVIRAKRRA